METSQAVEQGSGGSAMAPPKAPPEAPHPPEADSPGLAEVLTEFEKELKTQMGEDLPKFVETPTEAETPEGETTPEGNDGESQEKPEVDYGAIPQAPVMGKDQEPMTIGQMKDEITERRTQTAKVEKLEFDLMQQRDMVNQILANDGPVSEAQKQQFEEMRQTLIQRQVQTVNDMFPEWQDPAIRQKVVPELTRIAKSAGYSDAEISTLTHPSIFNLLERVRRYEEREALGIKAMQSAAKPRAEKGKSPPPRSSKGVKFQEVAGRISEGHASNQDWRTLGKILGVD